METIISKGKNFGDFFAKNYQVVISFSHFAKEITEKQIDQITNDFEGFFTKYEPVEIYSHINREVSLTVLNGYPVAFIKYSMDPISGTLHKYDWNEIEKDLNTVVEQIETILYPFAK